MFQDQEASYGKKKTAVDGRHGKADLDDKKKGRGGTSLP